MLLIQRVGTYEGLFPNHTDPRSIHQPGTFSKPAHGKDGNNFEINFQHYSWVFGFNLKYFRRYIVAGKISDKN